MSGLLSSLDDLNPLDLASHHLITDRIFRHLVENVFSVLKGGPEIHNMSTLSTSKPDLIKELYADLLATTTQLVRSKQSRDEVVKFLTRQCGIATTRAGLFGDLYEKYRDELEMTLINVGTHPDHITDVSWRCDYVLKSTYAERGDGPLFRIALQVEKFVNSEEKKGVDYVNFCCNTQELQDLVYKLKDAVRHCQRIGSEH